MSQLKENKPPAARSSGPKLVTNFNDFMSQAASTATDRSAAPSKTSKPASTAEKTRQQKILDILGDPTPQGKGKNTDAGWKLPSTSAHASSSREGPLPASLHQSQATQRDTNLPRMFNVAQPSLYKPTIPAGPSQRPRAPPSSRPSAGKAQAVSASQDAKFPCPYDDCKRGFRSLKDLRQHKLDEHDFCKVCDEDFEDFDALHKHKIVSERHITCTVCSVDFQSETGRDRHYTQMHGSAHDIRCRGCDVTFAKGAALLHHFEHNLCRPAEKPGISANRFESQRAGIAMLMQARNRKLQEQGESGSLDSLPGILVGGSVAPSTIGGVPIEPAEQPDFLLGDDDETRSLQFPPLPGASGAGSTSPTESHASTNLLLSEHDFPALNASNLARLNEKNLNEETTPKASVAGWPAVGKDKDCDDVTEGVSNMSMSTKLVPDAKPILMPEGFVPPSIQPSRSGYSNLDYTNSLQLQPNAVSGQWECPFYKCSFKCDLRQDLELHFQDRNNGHRGYNHVCPSCLKRFKTSSALMAHLESASTRCSIRDSKGYGNVLHLVSGGHLNVAGRHNDGSNRIVSPEDAGKEPNIIW